MKVFDCFLFFNELDLLELRLELLNDKVDYFVISECDYTFSGNPKPFYFEENKERFSKFLHKIIHVKNYNSDKIENINNPHSGNKREIFEKLLGYYNSIKNTPETDYGKPWWCRDFLHREFVKLGMDTCLDDDIIMFGDLDEIPNPELLNFDRGTYICELRHMNFSLDLENISEPFQGTIITNYGKIKNESLGLFRNRKRHNGFDKISNAGWHLTSLGGTERVKTKIASWGHQELHRPDIISNVETNLKTGRDVFNRPATMIKRSLEEIYPERMCKMIKEKYMYLIINSSL